MAFPSVSDIDVCVSRNDASALKSMLDTAISVLPEGRDAHAHGHAQAGTASAAVEGAKAVLGHMATRIDDLQSFSSIQDVCSHALSALAPRLSSAEDADLAFRLTLARTYAGEGDAKLAGQTLAQARLDSDFIPARNRALAYVRTIQYFLEDEDAAAAETYLRRAADLVRAVNDRAILLPYKTCQARMLDQRRKFMEASLRYIDITRQVTAAEVGEAEIGEILTKAARCIILAPAGPQRQRVMGTLMRDDNIELVNPIVLSMLGKMYNEQFVSLDELSRFDALLEVHQKAVGADGYSVPRRACLEHNLLSARKVYKNVTFASLAGFLGIDAAQVETMAAKMIKEKRLEATIDQVEGYIDFVEPTGASAATDLGTAGGVDTLMEWDAAIKEVCISVNATVEAITKAHPELAAVH